MRLITAAQCLQARALLGWSRQDLAASAGVAVHAVSEFEDRVRLPSSATLMALAYEFDIEGVKFSGARGVGYVSTRFDGKARPDPRRLGLGHEIETG